MKRKILRAAWASCMLAGFACGPSVWAVDTDDLAAIRQVMMSTWDQPTARLDVGPVVVQGDHAVASWTQEKRGGRALLQRSAQGAWRVVACAGDGFKNAKTLELTGLPASRAQQLAWAVAKAEAAVSPQRRSLFSTFDGMVRMDGAEPHAHGAHGAKQ